MSTIKSILKQAMRMPYAADCYLAINDILGESPKYDCCWRYLPKWIDELEKVKLSNTQPLSRILFFSTTIQWNNFALALSVVLAARNIEVDFVWALHPHIIVSDPVMGYRHWMRYANKVKLLANSSPRLRVHSLMEVKPDVVTQEMEVIAYQQALMDTSYLLRKECVQVDKDCMDYETFELRRKQNLDTISRISTILKNSKYDRVIVPNGVALDFGAVFAYATKTGLPVSSIEFWDIQKTVVASRDGPVVGINTNELWTRDEPHILSAAKRARVQKVINTRQKPSSESLTIKYQSVVLETPEKIKQQLGLSLNKPTVLLCPNVPFDSIFYVERNKNFPTMGEWLKSTIKHFSTKEECQLIIRSHPAEMHFESTDTTEKLVKSVFPILPSNITLLPPDAPINTYSLMGVADMGLVYASTTGLEMAMRGIPVVCGISSQHYNKKGFTIDPVTSDDYFRWIDLVLKEPGKYRQLNRQIELAWCYADVFFNQWTLPFPWHAETMGRDIKTWTIERMISSEGKREFGNIFNILSGGACE